MKEIPLTQGYVALVDDGDFERVAKFKWCASVDKRTDGSITNVYATHGVRTAVRTASGKRKSTQQLHRFILELTDPLINVDHKNHNGLDCRRENLRTCSRDENMRNMCTPTTNSSGFKGVSWHKGDRKWRAYIKVSDGLKKRQYAHLGNFDSREQAAAAYNAAAVQRFGEFALLNQIGG